MHFTKTVQEPKTQVSSRFPIQYHVGRMHFWSPYIILFL